ncbi:hypothetical protein KL86DES1_21019 [uncultured Desulfovibrio sp.]|uniref:Uncharacterized protein n=1 Tax=uncultured Desulfovibrio sp. TaxID=167968 RepID=A0A212L695_9BACT|nr:hypothetical protein KL86DES1_21019 [uncultured Desulfovibrio sp.]VZH33919.1 conserved protein of unknown function [Desulfovibrio sp. 86]
MLCGGGTLLDQINFEMFHISKLSFSRKCDLRYPLAALCRLPVTTAISRLPVPLTNRCLYP